MPDSPSVGQLLRDWRVRRRMSQLDLATEAGISARHLSFVETGRSKPSREMVLHLAEHLDVPLRERNPLLIAAATRLCTKRPSSPRPRWKRHAKRSRNCCARTSPIPRSSSTGAGIS